VILTINKARIIEAALSGISVLAFRNPSASDVAIDTVPIARPRPAPGAWRSVKQSLCPSRISASSLRCPTTWNFAGVRTAIGSFDSETLYYKPRPAIFR
jgi:hypothetical protein